MAELAEQIARKQPEIVLGKIKWDSFKDGFPNIKIMDTHKARNNDIAFLTSFDTPGEIFKQLSLIYEIPRLVVNSFKVLLPFYPTGTMERVDEEGDIATASTLARMLSAIPNSISGPAQIIIYDIHALQERFYFSDTVIPRLETAVPLLKNRIKSLKNIAIAFPDEGAFKRFGKMFKQYPVILCDKIRENDKRIVSIKQGSPEKKHVLIIDDLVMTGGTLLQCSKTLLEHGAKKISAYVTHGVFPMYSWEKFLNAGFSRFWITDSCPATIKAVKDKKPFEILSLGQALAEVLK